MTRYFFFAGHVQYVRHITQHTMEIYAHAEDNVDRLCCHQDGYWNVLSLEKFVDYNCDYNQPEGAERHGTVCRLGLEVDQRIPFHVYSRRRNVVFTTT